MPTLMSAPHIPNLNTRRRGVGRDRGRGRGLSSEQDVSEEQRAASQDKIVQGTDVDAATSRLSAVQNGYLDDPFAHLLVPGGTATKRLPLMNRGTYARTAAIDRLVEGFLFDQPVRRKQVISLGAGSDTRFFRIKQKHPEVDLIYHELDFATNTTAKIHQIRSPAFVHLARQECRVDLLSDGFHVSDDLTKFTSTGPHQYFVHAQDLRQLPTATDPLPGIDRSVPTLLLSECCLVYLPPQDADAVLTYFTSLFPSATPLGIVIYEPINPGDAFGRTMVSNLTARGIHLKTLQTYGTIDLQKARLQGFGFGPQGQGTSMDHGSAAGVGAMDLDFMWRTWLDEEEKRRIDGLEWMDEVEEWVLLMKHYCLAWGWRDGSEHEARSTVFAVWKEILAGQ